MQVSTFPVNSRRLVLGALGIAVVLLAACDRYRDRQYPFDGFLYKTRTSAVDKKVSRADFVATVFSVSQSLAGARQAARYEGTKYCIAQYGTSQVKWTVGPESPAESLKIIEDTLTFSGRCDP